MFLTNVVIWSSEFLLAVNYANFLINTRVIVSGIGNFEAKTVQTNTTNTVHSNHIMKDLYSNDVEPLPVPRGYKSINTAFAC